MQKNRDDAFDLLKGFLIILVILGHSIQFIFGYDQPELWEMPEFNVIYSFHMPLFIFISGYFFKTSLKKTFIEVLRGKFKRLLLPAMIYSAVIILLYVLITDDIFPRPAFIYRQCRTYWYLICVFILTLAYWVFFKGGKNVKCAMAVIYLLLLSFYDYLPSYILKDCQLIRHTFIFGFAASLSLYWSDALKKLIGNVRYGGGGFVLFAVVASVIRVFYGINMMHYPVVIRITDGFVCSMMVLLIVYPLLRKVGGKSYLRPLAFIGRQSLAIYLVHIIFFRVYVFSGAHLEYTFLNVTMLFTILLLLSLLFVTIVKQLLKDKSYILGV